MGADQLVIANVVGEETKALLGDSGKVCIINGKEGKTDFCTALRGLPEVAGGHRDRNPGGGIQRF